VITETSAVSFRQNLGEMINQVQFRHDSIVINKDGKAVAALVDARLFARIRQMHERFDALAACVRHGADRARAGRDRTVHSQGSRRDGRQDQAREEGLELCPVCRVVLDTNVLVSGLAYPGSVPGRIVAAWRQGALDVVLSRHLLDELARVLPRLNHRLH
jgi:prevent-host-death family protein